MREENQSITVEDEYGFPVKVSFETARRIYAKMDLIFKTEDIENEINSLSEDTYDEYANELDEAFENSEFIAESLYDALSKNDSYWDRYWESVDIVIDDYIKTTRKFKDEEHKKNENH